MGYCGECGEILRSTTCPCGGEAGKTLTDMGDGTDNIATKMANTYLSSGLGQGIDTGLRRMLDMDPATQKDCNCFECGKKLHQTGDVFVGQNDDLPYCKPCYTEKFKVGNCGKCDGAVIGLGEQYVKENGKFYHKGCYSGTACCMCLETIMGEALMAGGSAYHPACFKCYECSKELESFVSHSGRVYCKPCAPKKTTVTSTTNYGKQSGFISTPVNAGINSNTGSGVTDDMTESDKRELNNAAAEIRQKELQNIREGNNKWVNVKDKCHGCEKEMYANGIETSFGMYHRECFVCKACGKDFSDGKYSYSNGAVYHSECVKKPSGTMCTLCNKGLSGSYLAYQSGKIHPDCFKCTKCSKNLNGQQFGEHQKQPYCASCLQQVAQPTTSTVDKGIRGGFTVDPRTGKKTGRTYGGGRVQGVAPIVPDSKKCYRCNKAVYAAEKVAGPEGQPWHKACLTCKECGNSLELGKVAPHNKEAYCKNCHGKLFGPKGVGFGQGAGALNRT